MSGGRWVLVSALALGAAGCGESEGGTCDSSLQGHSAVITFIDIGREEPAGVAEGIDLDAHVSEKGDPIGCRKADLVDASGRQGIDNQLATLWPILLSAAGDGGGALEGLLQGAINDGKTLLMVLLEGIDDFENDPCLTLTIQRGLGRPFLGTDGTILPGQTFDLDRDSPRNTVSGARIEDGVLHAGPMELDLPMSVLERNFILPVHDVVVRAKITPGGGLDGVIGGAVIVEEMVDMINAIDGPDLTGGALAPLAGPILSGAADLRPDAAGKCQAVSAALPVRAVNAFVYEDSGSAANSP